MIRPWSSVLTSVVCVLLWGDCFVVFGAYSSCVPLVLFRWVSVLGLGLCSVCYGCPVLVLLVRSLGCAGTGADIATDTAAATAVATVLFVRFSSCEVMVQSSIVLALLGVAAGTGTGTGTAAGGVVIQAGIIPVLLVLFGRFSRLCRFLCGRLAEVLVV